MLRLRWIGELRVRSDPSLSVAYADQNFDTWPDTTIACCQAAATLCKIDAGSCALNTFLRPTKQLQAGAPQLSNRIAVPLPRRIQLRCHSSSML